MARCRQLLQENEDIAKMVSSGRLAKLEGELAMHKKLVEEMKKNQVETDDFVQELDEDMVTKKPRNISVFNRLIVVSFSFFHCSTLHMFCTIVGENLKYFMQMNDLQNVSVL